MRATPFSSTSASIWIGATGSCCTSSHWSAVTSASCRSKNLPSGVRTMVPVSRPCSTVSRSRRCNDRQIRLVTQKAMGGATKNAMRKNQVRSLIDMLSLIAMMSLPEAKSSTE